MVKAWCVALRSSAVMEQQRGLAGAVWRSGKKETTTELADPALLLLLLVDQGFPRPRARPCSSSCARCSPTQCPWTAPRPSCGCQGRHSCVLLLLLLPPRPPLPLTAPADSLPSAVTKDQPTQYRSQAYASKVPIAMDAAPVMTLRASGALILGKTTTTEFATCQRGCVVFLDLSGRRARTDGASLCSPDTTNPHDPTRTAGGSSSGSGAAVGDFQVPIALGSESPSLPSLSVQPDWQSASRSSEADLPCSRRSSNRRLDHPTWLVQRHLRLQAHLELDLARGSQDLYVCAFPLLSRTRPGGARAGAPPSLSQLTASILCTSQTRSRATRSASTLARSPTSSSSPTSSASRTTFLLPPSRSRSRAPSSASSRRTCGLEPERVRGRRGTRLRSCSRRRAQRSRRSSCRPSLRSCGACIRACDSLF